MHSGILTCCDSPSEDAPLRFAPRRAARGRRGGRTFRRRRPRRGRVERVTQHPGPGHRRARQDPGHDRPDAPIARPGPARRGVRGVQGRVPRPLRDGRDPAPRRRPRAHAEGRGDLRRDPRPHQVHRDDRSGARQDRRAARHHRRRRAQAHVEGSRRADAGVRPGVHGAVPRGPRGGATAVGPARLPRVDQELAVQEADPVGGRGGRRRHDRDVLRDGRGVLGAAIRSRGTRSPRRDSRRGRAVLRVVLADRASRAATLARIPEGARVDGGVGRLGRDARADRLHVRVPRRFRDGAVLPGPDDVRRWSGRVGRRWCRHRRGRAGRGRVRHLPVRAQAADPHVPVDRGRDRDGHVGRVHRQRSHVAARGGRARFPPAGRLAEVADLPRPDDRLPPDDRERPRTGVARCDLCARRALHVRDPAASRPKGPGGRP